MCADLIWEEVHIAVMHFLMQHRIVTFLQKINKAYANIKLWITSIYVINSVTSFELFLNVTYVRLLLIKKYTIQVKEKFLLNQIIIINGVYSYIDFNFKLHSSVKSCSL